MYENLNYYTKCLKYHYTDKVQIQKFIKSVLFLLILFDMQPKLSYTCLCYHPLHEAAMKIISSCN